MKTYTRIIFICICSIFLPADTVLGGDDLLGGLLGGLGGGGDDDGGLLEGLLGGLGDGDDEDGGLLGGLLGGGGGLGGILGGVLGAVVKLLKEIICLVNGLLQEVQHLLKSAASTLLGLICKARDEQGQAEEECKKQDKDIRACIIQENICLDNVGDESVLESCRPASLDKTQKALDKLKSLEAQIEKYCRGPNPPCNCELLREEAEKQQKIVRKLSDQLKIEVEAAKCCLADILKPKEVAIQKCRDDFKKCVEKAGCVPEPHHDH